MAASAQRRGRSVAPGHIVPSLEERLHHAHQQLALLADLFDLHALAPDYMQNGALSSPACCALAILSRQGATDLRRLLDELPADVKNWSAAPAKGTSGAGSKR
jgi:hypothetical protein